MTLDQTLGRCLVSQEIRQLIQEQHLLVPSFSESRIQPSSFEPTLGDEAFVLDTEDEGIFLPTAEKQVYQTLLEIPSRRRQRIDLSSSKEFKVGFSYLIPLEEKVSTPPSMSIKASPKSSIGRVFLDTRMVADYNPTFNEATCRHQGDALRLWLLVQPLNRNVLVQRGLSLNQLRFFSGLGASMGAQELLADFQREPLLYLRQHDGSLLPAEPDVKEDGLTVHLDLLGKTTEGIVGLRARHSPSPIDLTSSNHRAEDFFEPLKAKDGRFIIKPRQGYLFATQEVLKVPPDRNAELNFTSETAFRGSVHFAGFMDNDFVGEITLEVQSDESGPMTWHHGMPIGKLRFFRTIKPDKLYGAQTGAHYQQQSGPKLAKFFGPFDFKYAAKNYGKLERLVLVHDARVLRGFRTEPEGFEPLDGEGAINLLHAIETRGFFHSRYDCEEDELVLQPIPYVLLFGPDNKVFTYQRAENRQHYGEQRLFGKHSVGVGGHISKLDAPHLLERCLQREIDEEVVLAGTALKPTFVGTLFQTDRPVDRVHFGLVYALQTNGQISPKESSIVHGTMRAFSDLRADVTQHPEHYETWSRVLIPHLQTISASL